MSGLVDRFLILQRLERPSGTYSMCGGCTDHCCSRAGASGEVDAPVLLNEEIEEIALVTREAPAKFLEQTVPSGTTLAQMTATKNGCYFYRSGRCAIYESRPLDCRLFPFDVIEKPSGSLVLIAYTELCPVSYDPFQYLNDARELILRLGDQVRAYAQRTAPKMQRQKFLEIGELSAILAK